MSDGEHSPTPPATARPTRGGRILRWPTRILAIVGVVMLVLLLVQLFVLPRVVAVIVHRALVDFGFKNVSFDVQRVSFVHTRITDFRLDGEGVNRVGGISADYTLKSLLDGRINALRIERAEIQISIAEDGSVDVGPLDLSASDSSKKESKPPGAGDARLPFDRLEVVDSTLNVAWEERRIAVPVRGTVWDLGQQKSSIELVATLYDAPLRINGTLDASGETMEISAAGSNWRIADVLATIPHRLTTDMPQLAGQVDVEASYRRDGNESVASGRVRAALTPTTQPADDMSISGMIRAEANVRLTPSGVVPLVTIATRGLDVSDPVNGYLVRGASGSVTLNSFSPLRSPGGQTINIAEAEVGQLKLSGGVLTFGIDSSAGYSVEKLETAWAGGRLAATPFRFDLTKPILETLLTAQNVELEQLLLAFAEKKVSGRGRVSGQVPMRLVWRTDKHRGEQVVNWGEPRLVLGEGYLRAEPGGELSLADPEGMLGDYLEKDPAYRKGGQMESVKKDLMASLRNLKYSTLRLQFVERGDNLVPSVRIAGKGQGPRGREIDITINLHGFEGLLKRSMSIRKVFG